MLLVILMSNLIVSKEIRANEYKYKAKWIVSHKLSGLKSQFFLFEISVRIINVVVSLCLPHHTPTEGRLLLGAIFYPNGKRLPWRLLVDKKTGSCLLYTSIIHLVTSLFKTRLRVSERMFHHQV